MHGGPLSYKLEAVIAMSFKKLKRSIEGMPRAPYIFLKLLLILACAMLALSLLLLLTGSGSLSRLHLAILLLEAPAGVLLLGCLGLAFLLDRSL